MDRRALLGLGIYAALVLSLVTPLYDALGSGRDDSWALLVLVVSAHIGLALAVARAWVLALPAALSVAAFLLSGAGGLAWMALFLGAPVLIGVTAAGYALGRRLERRGSALALGFFAVALLPAAWAAVETSQRGPHVSASVQSELPTEISLGNLCPGTMTPTGVEQDVRRRAEALIRELRQRPDHLVTYTHYYSDDPEERRDITIRELAEEQLKDMESNGPNCEPGLQRRLRAAM